MNTPALRNEHVTNMAALEKHILEALERQLASDALARYPEAAAVVKSLAATLKRHVTALEALNARTEGGGIAEAVKEAVAGALGVAAGLYDQVRDEVASRMIRDDYTATSLAAVSYHMLYTTALGLKQPATADLALRHLRDLTPLLVDLSKVVCHVVAREMAAEEPGFDASVGAEAERRTQEAWSASHVEQGA
jgi:hypothetical protein